MFKICLIVACVWASGCSRPPEVTQFSDEYVLIEFAAKLEEDYQQIYPEPLEKPKPTTTK